MEKSLLASQSGRSFRFRQCTQLGLTVVTMLSINGFGLVFVQDVNGNALKRRLLPAKHTSQMPFRSPDYRSRSTRYAEQVRRTVPSDEDFSDDLDVDGELEDDWSTDRGEEPHKGALNDEEKWKLEELRRSLNITDEEAALWEEGVDGMFQDGKIPDDVRSKLNKFANPGSLDAFKTVGGAVPEAKWVGIHLNDTWKMEVAQVPGAISQFINMMQTGTEANQDVLDAFQTGDSVWPASVVLARWMVIHPPPVQFRGKVVVELGSGLGLPGVLAARLGAERVLLQDRSEACLRESLETALLAEVVDRITTLRCNWEELPDKLLSNEVVLAPFQLADVFLGADILFDKNAAEEVAQLLSVLLQTPSQVAYLVDPYKRAQKSTFKSNCKKLGLNVQENEIVTWEPEWDNRFETGEEWVTRLLIVTRPDDSS